VPGSRYPLGGLANKLDHQLKSNFWVAARSSLCQSSKYSVDASQAASEIEEHCNIEGKQPISSNLSPVSVFELRLGMIFYFYLNIRNSKPSLE
jgi:hypothetical protein